MRRGNPEGHTREKNWIASSQRLLAMTAESDPIHLKQKMR
jgi:hypothetical protein